MRNWALLILGAFLVASPLSLGLAGEPPLGISGEWTGTAVSSEGKMVPNHLSVTEHPDGRLTGKWGHPDELLTIEKGERVTPETLQWESPSGKGRYRVRCVQKGKSLVIDWSYTYLEDRMVRGHTGTTVLVRK
jgi:hypothetical protein